MSAPVFSIVTVTWNAGAALGATAESLLSQTFADYEWLVIDGASTDGTAETARRLADPVRDRVVSEPDDGLYFAMNKGLELARGEVVQFLNAGDRFADDGVLARVAAAFGPDVDVVYGDSRFELPGGRVVDRVAAADLAVGLRRRVPICHQALFVRRKLHLAHRFDTSYRIAADYAAMASLHEAGARFRHLPGILNVNSLEPGEVSVRGRARIAAESVRIQREILGMGRIETAAGYAGKRVRGAAVRLLQSLPDGLVRRLPDAIRRRVY